MMSAGGISSQQTLPLVKVVVPENSIRKLIKWVVDSLSERLAEGGTLIIIFVGTTNILVLAIFGLAHLVQYGCDSKLTLQVCRRSSSSWRSLLFYSEDVGLQAYRQSHAQCGQTCSD